MKNDAELPKTNPWNKIKKFNLPIAVILIVAGLAWALTQGIPWLDPKPYHSLPFDEAVDVPWRAFYAEQTISKGESLEDWMQRTQRTNPGHWNFWLTQLQGLELEMAYPVLRSPHVDSLLVDVSTLWNSTLPEIKNAKSTLNKVILRYQALQKISERDKLSPSNPSSSTGNLSTSSKTTKPLEIIGMVGLFQYQTALTDSSIWVGLDMFMNEDYRYYPSVEHLYAYQRRRTAPRCLPIAVARTLAEDWVHENLFMPPHNETTLLDQIIREGQTLACMRWLFPEIHDTLLLGYSGAQWKWIKDHQQQVWRDLVSKDLLFTGDPAILSRYLNDGPFSSGYAQQSPPALGLFIGDAIVQKWIQSDGETQSIPPWTRLLNNKNLPATQILKKSGYKGR